MTPRRAAPADADALARLHAAAFDAPWPATELRSLVASERCACLVVDDAGLVIVSIQADEAEILTLAVAPDSRRCGVGRALVEAAAQEAAARGATRLFLEVADDNAVARALYGGLGFACVGRRRGYYARQGAEPVDALILARALVSRVDFAHGPAHIEKSGD